MLGHFAGKGGSIDADRDPAAEPGPDASDAPTTAPSYPTIVRLVGREITVTISAGRGRNLFSAHRADGTMLASNVTLDELRDKAPTAYRQVQPALAAATDVRDVRDRNPSIGVWAGMDAE